MWRKPDAKPSSDTPASSVPSRTHLQSTVQPAHSGLERPASARVANPASEAVSSQSASRIGAGLKIRGEVTGDADLYLDGEINGTIRLAGGCVTVGPQGRVQADIDAKEIVINGSVQGNLKADGKLRLGASSHVDGALKAPSIGIEDGARFHGKVEVTRTMPAPSILDKDSTSDADLKPVAAHAEGE